MTVVGLDDTDSRELGMCTTYAAARIARRLRRHGHVERPRLVRLNPAVPHKTRGNAALAVPTDCDAETAFSVAREELEELSETADEATNPGLVVAEHDGAGDVPEAVADFARAALRDHLEIADAERLLDREGYREWHSGNGRGRIGALAGIGALAATTEWTYEYISYRRPERWGTDRTVDEALVRRAADEGYPAVWDTVDRGAGEVVCVPRTPGPILHGIRGDEPDAVRAVAEGIEGEPVHASELFVTNQGTDAHLQEGSIGALEDGRAYRVEGVVTSTPETRRGGHVFVEMAAPEAVPTSDSNPGSTTVTNAGADEDPDAGADADASTETVECAAFEPTKRFRDRVRALRPGDRITACGELARGTLKLEKFAVRSLNRTERVTPTCPDCERTMESAGRDQGYRCRDCGTSAAGKAIVERDRDLERGWYEVPPRARRHVAKPLVRGGFDAPTHPER